MMDEMEKTTSDEASLGDGDALAELDSLFSEEDERLKKSETSVLTQNLAGFANCFPDWDLHPPVD